MSAGAGRGSDGRYLRVPPGRERPPPSIWGPGSKIWSEENLGSGQNHRRKQGSIYHLVSLKSNLSIGSFCAQSGKSHLPRGFFFAQNPRRKQWIWGVPAGGVSEQNNGSRYHRGLARFGELIRRRELPFRPHLPAHIPRMTFVSTGQTPSN